jgi:HEAT repeat protein
MTEPLEPIEPLYDSGLQAVPLAKTAELLAGIGTGLVPAAAIYGLNDLTALDIERLKPTWLALDEDVRRRVLIALNEAAEMSFELNFWTLARFALNDEAVPVRVQAIELLWEDVSTDVLEAFLRMVRDDEATEVRAAAAIALGSFVFRGEMDELSPEWTERTQETLFDVWSDPREDVDVRRRALEALANSSREGVDEAIQEAYASDDQRLQVSAVFAMGKSADDRWGAVVLEELESDEREIRFEATRAAGELSLEDAVPVLTELVYEDDVEIRDAAVWSLGEIGGREVQRVLNLLADEARENEDEDLLAAVEDAIAAATLGADLSLYMLDLDDDEPRA